MVFMAASAKYLFTSKYPHLDEAAVEDVLVGGGVEARSAAAGVAAPHPPVTSLEHALPTTFIKSPFVIRCYVEIMF